MTEHEKNKLTEIHAHLFGLKREHYECDDPFYSCAKAENYLHSELPPNGCTCGADVHNSKLNTVIKAIEELKKHKK